MTEAKAEYQQSLRNLEYISNDIHEQRDQGKLRRESNEQTSNTPQEQSNHTEPVRYSFTVYFQNIVSL